jgi:uncharacterized protein (TIGR02118 family)
MIKVSVLYPNEEGKKFDIEYYCCRHIAMIQEQVGSALKGVAVEQGLCAADLVSQAPYVVMGHLYFDSMEVYESAYVPRREGFRSDIPNFTDIKPIVQISEVRII